MVRVDGSTDRLRAARRCGASRNGRHRHAGRHAGGHGDPHRQRRARRFVDRFARLLRREREPVFHALRHSRHAGRRRRAHRHGPAPHRSARGHRRCRAVREHAAQARRTPNTTHAELEGNEVGTRFDNTSDEGRLEVVHLPIAGWNGAFGVQWGVRDFSAVGEEAFVPSTQGRDAGLFWIGNREFGDAWRLELGARGDRNEIDADAADAIGPDRDVQHVQFLRGPALDASDALHLDLRPGPRATRADRRRVVFQRHARGDAERRTRPAGRSMRKPRTAPSSACIGTRSDRTRRRRSTTCATTTSSTSPTPG